jgi:hypothetical protein
MTLRRNAQSVGMSPIVCYVAVQIIRRTEIVLWPIDYTLNKGTNEKVAKSEHDSIRGNQTEKKRCSGRIYRRTLLTVLDPLVTQAESGLFPPKVRPIRGSTVRSSIRTLEDDRRTECTVRSAFPVKDRPNRDS